MNVDPLGGVAFVQYARRLSDVEATANRVRFFLGLGVLGGTMLALLAGVATARRAMTPIAELTETARTIERTRDPSRRIPHPEAEDEVAELARTLDGMLHALDGARSETEATLDAPARVRRRRVARAADAADLGAGEPGAARGGARRASSARRPPRRCARRGACAGWSRTCCCSRAPTRGAITRHEPVDVADVVTEAAGELEPVVRGPRHHGLRPGGRGRRPGARDELHRLALNLMENALRHTDPGTAVEASVERVNGQVVFSVEDDGPGIPPELHDKVFERFFRGAGDRSGSSGLGLAIVRAVAESHHGTVTLEDPLDGRGARFVVRFPSQTSA